MTTNTQTRIIVRMENLAYLNALNYIASLTPQAFFYLLKTFDNNPRILWNASYSELKKTRLDEKSLQKFIAERKSISPEQEIGKIEKQNISICIHPSIDIAFEKITAAARSSLHIPYPDLLSHIPTPPPVLYCKGKIHDDVEVLRIAVVGSRKITRYGLHITETIAYNLAIEGIIIVSGFALGVDTVAHKAALKAQKPTLAVMGHGLDTVYPPLNTRLAGEVVSLGGALVSEFPLGVPPLKQHFPRRNRIISGLCKGVLITEAAIKSGSLITALHAIEQNRDVFAIPGNITQKNSEGTNSLIKRGAKLTTSADDILQEFNLAKTQTPHSLKHAHLSSQNEQNIYELISQEPLLIDTIIRELNLSAPEVNTVLTMMEIKGIVKNIGGGWYTALK